jgi:hypothetical protein
MDNLPLFTKILKEEKEKFFVPYAKKYFKEKGTGTMAFAECMYVGSEAEAIAEKYGENDPRAVEKYLEFGLCVCDKTNNKPFGDAVVKCLDENKDTLEMFNTCHNQMEAMFNQVQIESKKFSDNFPPGLIALQQHCGKEASELQQKMMKFGPQHQQTVAADIKQQSCVVPLVCKKQTDEAKKCVANTNGELKGCEKEIELMIKCSVEQIQQPAYDMLLAAQPKKPVAAKAQRKFF